MGMTSACMRKMGLTGKYLEKRMVVRLRYRLEVILK
jgi:hypothetical protein